MVEVAFGEGEVVVEEGRGVLGVTLVKTEGAIGPVRVRLFSLSGTASGKPLSLITDLKYHVQVDVITGNSFEGSIIFLKLSELLIHV